MQIRRRRAVTALWVSLIVSPAMELSAADLYVATSGDDTNDCRSVATACLTIQRAVSVAAPSGDVVHVEAGTYTESVTISRSITIQGADRDATIVTSGGLDRVFEIRSGTVLLTALSVTGGVAYNGAGILSDGTPWRPMINTKDMARAFEWGVLRTKDFGGAFLAVNTGCTEWNTQVKPLAEAIATQIPGAKVSTNPDAVPDKRSYRVNFELYKELAPDHQPLCDLQSTINEVRDNLEAMGFNDPNFRESQFIRLKVLSRLREQVLLDDNLEWIPC